MNLRSAIYLLTFLVASTSSEAAQRQLTVFSDGTLAEIEAVASKGIAEVVLPTPIRDNSLRVKPLDNASIEQVALLPFRMPDNVQRELDQLTEQKQRLEDRLKALDTREDIFEAAAKSQSSKAPRKTKTNPDPLASVRQGTDFAIAQLEAVFTARRRAEQELKRIGNRIAQLTKVAVGGPTARVTVIPANGRVRVAAVLDGNGWRPRYELRLDGSGTAHLTQLAVADLPPVGFASRVTPTTLSDGMPQRTTPLLPGKTTPLTTWQLPVTQQSVSAGPLPRFSITLQNTTNHALPAGEATIYYLGEFLGTVMLASTAADAPLTVSNLAP